MKTISSFFIALFSGIVFAMPFGASAQSCDNLIDCATEGHLAEVQRLIKAGADVNTKDEWDNTVLMFAADKGHANIVQELIKAGADVNAKNDYKTTALMWATRWGNIDSVKELIKGGADINAKNRSRDTALDMAKLYNHSKIIYILSSPSKIAILREEGKAEREDKQTVE